MTRADLEDIARCSVLAPSADNQHRFRIRLDPAALRFEAHDVLHDAHQRVLQALSLGAVVENAVLRAGELGYDAKVRWSLGTSTGELVRVDLTPEPRASADPLARHIASRHTNRRLYRGPAPDAAMRAALSGAADPGGGATLTWLEGGARRRALRLIRRAETERFRVEALHRELFDSIRFDVGWTRRAERGLPPGALEVEAPLRGVFAALRRWKTMRVLNRAGASRMLGMRAGWFPCWQAPALAVLSTTRPLPGGAAEAGRALQRVWLQAGALGLAMQPMAASTVLAYAPQADEPFREALVQGWRAIVGEALPLIVVRVGRAPAPAVRTARPPLEAFLAN